MNKAYCAGLFDGEGHIYLAKDLLHLQITVTQKEIPVLLLLKQEFGGTVSKYGKQNCHKWRIHSIRDMVKFLQTIRPYAFIKAGEIKIALEFLNGMNMKNKGCNPLSYLELNRRKMLFDALRIERSVA